MLGAISTSFAPGRVSLRMFLERAFAPKCAIAILCWLSLAAVRPAMAGSGAEPPPSETIAITKLPFAGIAHEVASNLQELLRATLHRAGFNVMPATVVENRLANEERLLGCSTSSCYGRLAQVLGVRRVVEGEVQRLELSTFTMKLGLRDLFTGRLVAPLLQERCDVCSNEDVRQMVVRAADTLSQMAPPTGPQETSRPTASGMLVLETDPPGAQITIDRELRNERTPASLLLGAGVHNLLVEGLGYQPLRRPVEILPAQQLPLYLILTPLPQRRPWLTVLAWTTAVAAVGLAVTGGVLLHYHNQPVTSPDCPAQAGTMFRCPYKYDFLAGSVSSFVGAGMLAVSSGLAFYFDNSAPRRRPISSP